MANWSITQLSIRRHIGTLMLTLAVIVLGVFSLTQLPVDLLPSITYPRIGLRLSASGISPDVAVDEVTRPLEEALAATEGVVQIYSRTREGRIAVDLYFEAGGNIDQALNDATAAVNRAQSSLPDRVGQPRLFKFDPSQLPVYEFALTSTRLSDMDLRTFADEELVRELNVVPGVASVDVSGGLEEEIRVELDLERLQALGISVTDVLQVLSERNQDVAGGRLLGDRGEPLTRTVGRFASVDEIRRVSLQTPGGGRVRLDEVAQIIDGPADQRIQVRLNGETAVKISVQKQPDANTILVVNGVKRKIEGLQQAGLLSEDFTLTATLDESEFIRRSVKNVAEAGIMGTILATIVVLLFLGSLRQAVVVVLAIPLATLTALILMTWFGLSLNIFSLGGLVLGVGIVLDNSIVMLENIARGVQPRPPLNNRHGEDPTESAQRSEDLIQQAEQSSQELESALLASTSTNLVAVLPFLLVGGFFSLLFKELILTISFAVAASLLVALTVVPMLASRLLGIRASSGLSRFWPIRAFQGAFEGGTIAYSWTLAKVIRRPAIVILLTTVLLGSGSYWMVNQLPQEILPRINSGQARLWAQFPPGTSLEANQQVMNSVDQMLLDQPETAYTFTTAGGFLFGSSTSENVLRGSSTITLKPGASVQAFASRVSQELEQLNVVDVRLRVSPGSVRGLIVSNSPVRGADLDVILQGPDTETLERAGRQVLQALDEQIQTAQFRPDADPSQPEVQIIPDWDRADAVGLSTQDLGQTIETAIQGTVPTELQRGDQLIDIRVKLAQGSVQQASELARLPLFLPDRHPLRLSDVARIELGRAPGEIQRINQRQVFIIEGSLQEGATLSEVQAQVDAVLAQLQLPDGVSTLPSSTAATSQELQRSLLLLGGLATFLVFVVMAVQYNTLIDPLVIMLTVPLSLAGGILGLYLTKTALGATVLVGAVLLVGIVVNNAIILVELANQLRDQQQLSYRQAILMAAPQRLRPILMTTLTTVLGLFPLALGVGQGSELLQPMGVVVFSGLSLATLLTLFIIPCFYVLLHGSGETEARKRSEDLAKAWADRVAAEEVGAARSGGSRESDHPTAAGGATSRDRAQMLPALPDDFSHAE